MAGVNIEIRENGPLRVVGPVTITDKDGKEYTIPCLLYTSDAADE